MIHAKQKPQVLARFKTVKCFGSNKTFNANLTCSIKAYSRNTAKLTVLVNFDVETNQILVQNLVNLHKNCCFLIFF